jgi:hypothetical protein
MKKGLVVLLILAMTGAAFAQEVKISGEVQTGLLFEQQGDSDLTVRPYNTDAEKTLRADLTVKVTNDNYGSQFRIRNDDGAFALHHAFVWGEFLNDIIKVSAGKIRTGNPWGTDGDEGFTLEVDGVRFELKPIEGLNIGFGLDAAAYGALAAGGGVLTAEDFFKETLLGVKYTSDLFNAGLAYKLDSEADGTSDEEAEFIFGLNIKAVSGLTAILEGKLSALGSDAIVYNIHEDFGYQLSDPLEAHLKLKETGNFDDEKAGEIWIEPGLSYGINAVTLKADLGFGIFAADDSAIEIDIKPGIAYAFSDTANINGWYKAAINPGGVKDSDLKNEIQIDFIWAF